MALNDSIPSLDVSTELASSKIAFRTVFGDALILGSGLATGAEPMGS